MGSDLYAETQAVKARKTKKPARPKKPQQRVVGPSIRDEQAARKAAIAAAAKARAAAAQRATELRAKTVERRLAQEASRGRDLAYETLAAKSRDLYRKLGTYSPDGYESYRALTPPPRDDTSLRAETRAVAAAKRVKQTGKYETEINRLRAQQLRSGGRFVDRDTYEAVTATYRAEAKRVAEAAKKEYDEATRRIKQFEKNPTRAGYDKLIVWLNRPEYLKAFEAYEKWFGKGRRPGRFERLEGRAYQISKDRERYISRQVAAYYKRPDVRAALQADEQLRRTLSEPDFKGPGSADRREQVDRPKMTIQEYLARAQKEYDDALRKGRDIVRGRERLYDFEGFERKDGRFQPKATSPEGRVRTWLTKGLAAKGAKITDYMIVDPRTGNFRIKGATEAERNRNLRFATEAAMDAWRAEQRMLGAKLTSTSPGAPNQAGVAADLATRRAIEQQIWQALSGSNAPGGFERVMYDAMGVPVLGDALRDLQFLGGVVITGGRIVLKATTGKSTIQVGFPYENLPPEIKKKADAAGARGGVGDATRRSRQDVISDWLKTPEGREWMQEQEAQQLAASQAQDSDLAQMLYGKGTDPLTVFQQMFSQDGKDTIASYGSRPTSNDALNLGLSMFIDPLIVAAPLRFLKAGKLAASRVGTASVRGLAKETWRLAGPGFTRRGLARLGGERGAYREAQSLAELGKVLGRNLRDEAELTAARADIEKILNAVTKEETGAIARKILGDVAPEREVRQLLSFVENLTGERAMHLGILPVSARKYHELGKSLESAVLRSEQEAALARGAADRIVGEEATRAAIQPVLELKAAAAGPTVRPVPTVSVADPVVVQAVREAGERQLVLVREARDAFQRAEAITDPALARDRVAAFQEAAAKYDRWRQDRGSRPNASGTRMVDGPVDDALDRLDAEIRQAPQGSRLEHVVREITALDVRDALHRMIRARNAGNVAEFARWKAAYEQGRRILRREKEHWKTVDRVVGQHSTEATEFVRQSDVAVVVNQADESDELFLRKLHAKVEGSPENPGGLVESADPMGPVHEDMLQRLEADPMVGAARVDFSTLPAALVRRYGDDLQRLDGRSVNTILEILSYLRNDDGLTGWGMSWYDDLFAWVVEKHVASAVANVFEMVPTTHASSRIPLFNQMLHRRHALEADNASGGTMRMKLKDYEKLDREISDAIAAVRGKRSQGVVRPRHRSGKSGGRSGAPATRDFELDEVVARLDAIAGSDFPLMRLQGWDQARGLLRQPNLVRNASTNIRARAEAVAARLGRPVDEVQTALLERRRVREGRIALRKFAASMPGATEEEIWAAYQLAQFSDLQRMGSPGTTIFQQILFKNIFEEVAGYPLGDVGRARYFHGELRPNARQVAQNAVPLQQFWDEPEFAGVPAFLVTHWENNIATPDVLGIHSVSGIESTMTNPHFVKTLFHELFHAFARRPAVFARLERMTQAFDRALALAGHTDLKATLHQYVDNGFYDAKVREYLSKGFSPSQAADKANVHLFEEAVAELYGWRRALRRGETGMPNQFFDFGVPGQTVEQALAAMPPSLRRIYGQIDKMFDEIEAAGMLPDSRYYGLSGLIDPPVENARIFREWMVARGHWSPRDARLIAEGQMSWSVMDERSWLEAYGYRVPERLHEDVLEKVIRDPELYDEAMRRWGYFGDDFDSAIAAHRIRPGADGQRAIAYGDGTKRGRSVQELRRYAAERYRHLVAEVHLVDDPTRGIKAGDLVIINDDVVLKDMPWLMTVDEFKRNIGRITADGLPPGVVSPERLPAFTRAIEKAVASRMDSWIADGVIERGVEWLPQERLLFTMRIADELLATGDWQGMFVQASKRRRALNAVGVVNRLNIVTNMAFPMMNSIDAVVFKPLLRALHYRDPGMLPVGRIDDDAFDAIRGLEDIGRRKGGVFNLGESRIGVIRERGVRTSVKVQAAFRLLPEWGLEISSILEDKMRLHFVRRVYMSQRDELIRRGWDPDSARMAAKYGAAREVQKFFPSLEDAGDFEKALNQLIPFLSYNARNTILGLKLIYTDPWVINLAQRLAAYVEESNRAEWERKNPGKPFPNDKAHMFWIEVDGQKLWFDLSEVSDWFRGSVKLSRSKSWVDFAGGLFRAPHPQQTAYLAWIGNMLDGGEEKTPWGTVADASILWPVDLFNYWTKAQVGDVPFALALSKTLFFMRAGVYTPTDARLTAWKALMDSQQFKAAQAYAERNPDVAAWLEAHRDPNKGRPGINGFSTNYYFHLDEDRRNDLRAAQDGLGQLSDYWDARMAPLVDKPWSEEYRRLKRERRAAFLTWYRMHPELAMAQSWNMDAREWADQKIAWGTDEDVDAYFAMVDARPDKDAFKSERKYLEALGAHQDAVEAYLLAHPNVVGRLRGEEGSVAAAWYDQQVRWDRILRDQTDISLAILDEEAKGDKANAEFVKALYALQKDSYKMIDAEAFAYRSEPSVLSEGKLLTDAGGLKIGPLTLLTPVKLPGRADYFYANSSPAEQAEIRDREIYFEKLDAYIAKATKDGEIDPAAFGRLLDKDPEFAEKYYAANPKAKRGRDYYLAITALYKRAGKYGFYRELEKDPGLMAEYFRRNPEKLARFRSYKEGTRYFEAITKLFQRSKNPKDFWAGLDKDPWLKRQYLARNPEKAALVAAGERYWKFAKTYTDLLASGDFAAAQRYWLSQPAELRDRFFKNSGGREWAANTQYAGAMGRWVEFLKRKDYDGARRFWDQLPTWIKDRYISKRPWNAKMLLSPSDLAQAGEYFLLPTVKEREAFLRKHPRLASWMNRFGGNAEARRGAIMSAYAALPKDAWLRRVFRERYPEIYSEEAITQRAYARTARRLAEHPELAGRFHAFVERVKAEFPHALGNPPPPPLTTNRMRAATRRRRARSRSALWAELHSRHGDL